MLNQLEIHVWGGFGSQLNALYLREVLMSRYPSRTLSFIFHSSGVSFRDPEIGHLLESIDWEFVNDFTESKYADSSNIKPNKFKETFKKIITSTRLVVEANDLTDLDKVKPWTRQIRGHYSNIEICKTHLAAFATKVLGQLIEEVLSADFSNEIVCQYRLGDLLNLPNKAPIPFQRILNAIGNLSGIGSDRKYLFLTDSVPQAQKIIKEGFPFPNQICVENFTPEETLLLGFVSGIFIGTTSKISIWIALLRYFFTPERITLMPSELTRNLLLRAPQILHAQNFVFY